MRDQILNNTSTFKTCFIGNWPSYAAMHGERAVARAKRLIIGLNKFALVARGANTQLDPSCVSAPLTTNVDLFACFAERLLKSSFLYMKGKLLTVQARSQW